MYTLKHCMEVSCHIKQMIGENYSIKIVISYFSSLAVQKNPSLTLYQKGKERDLIRENMG